ncbi:MAG: efflux RND transporter periplasmic adaptor subunit [Bacteroidales bacterium]|nr:efflux RND transporter periplasmic adaptor subunit [Bacteroidales bacterium]
MSIKKILVISLFLLLLIFLTVFKFVRCNEKKKETSRSIQQSALPVDVYLVRDTSVTEKIGTIGTLTANESVSIVSEISKKVSDIYMEEGTFVKKGQLLFKLDDSDIRAEINTLKVEEELAAANEKREHALLDKGGISQERYDEAANRLKTLQAQIATLDVELSKTEIRAPFSGKIGLRSVSEGAWVSPDVPLADLQDVLLLKIVFAVPQRYAGEIYPGQKVTISTDHSPDVYSAVVQASEPAVDDKTRTLKVQALLRNPGVKLIPGTSVKVGLQLQSGEASLFVPTQALIPSQEGYSVFVVKDGKAVNIHVKTGERTAEAVQILENLVPGDTLITTNLLRVRPGIPVAIQNIR